MYSDNNNHSGIFQPVENSEKSRSRSAITVRTEQDQDIEFQRPLRPQSVTTQLEFDMEFSKKLRELQELIKQFNEVQKQTSQAFDTYDKHNQRLQTDQESMKSSPSLSTNTAAKEGALATWNRLVGRQCEMVTQLSELRKALLRIGHRDGSPLTQDGLEAMIYPGDNNNNDTRTLSPS